MLCRTIKESETLASETKDAQKEEQERLRRLEERKEMHMQQQNEQATSELKSLLECKLTVFSKISDYLKWNYLAIKKQTLSYLSVFLLHTGEDISEAKEDEDVILLDEKKDAPEVSKTEAEVKPAPSKGALQYFVQERRKFLCNESAN